MSSLSRLRSRATSSFSAACCSPPSDTVRSYSGPNRSLSRSVLLRRPAEVATTSTTAMTITIAAITIHPHTGMLCSLLFSLSDTRSVFYPTVNLREDPTANAQPPTVVKQRVAFRSSGGGRRQRDLLLPRLPESHQTPAGLPRPSKEVGG